MERKYIGMFAFAMIAVLGFSMVSAYGLGMGRDDLTEEDRAEMEANREAMRNAVETGDYQAWEGLMQERLVRLEDSINEETFAEIQVRHEERVENGFEGRGEGKGNGRGLGMGQGHGMKRGLA